MRVFLLRGITVLVTVLFLYKLLDLQVRNTSYQTLSENNAVLQIEEYPERGFIYDRNGKLLVANQPAYDIMIIPENVLPFDTLSFCELTGIKKKSIDFQPKKSQKILQTFALCCGQSNLKRNLCPLAGTNVEIRGFFYSKKIFAGL